MAPIMVDEQGIFYKVFYNVATDRYIYYVLPGQDAKARTH